jgi:SpoVK/Ycf46/Vps4 family AAA+-type ATPase
MFGSFLSWLNDHESDVFVVCTANDVAKLPPEFARAERFDAIFFLDFPGREQKQAIWNIYLDLFEIDRDQKLPNDEQWSGAEIRASCRLLASGQLNVYTIEKGGQKKLIYQAPWYVDGEYRGLVELALPLPDQLPHFVRDSA